MSIRAMALGGAMALICAAAVSGADQAPGAAGHWEGSFNAPTPEGNKDVDMTVDLARGAGGTWTGSVDLGPLAKGLPLSDISSSGAAVHFGVKGVPGAPSFDGKLAADGQSMSGQANFGGQATTFKLTRKGDAKVAQPPKSTPVSKQLQGKWQGALSAQSTTLHLVLDIVNQADGTGGGTLTSVDQGNAEIPLSQVTQNGRSVTFGVLVIGGSFSGELNEAGTELSGQWTQGPNQLPLVFTKAGAEKK
ncbi:MAG TPA: hypothetical protein VFA04_02415 [Bryobacteraceae bacterium]|nr:hypothetical protein [Bryobacteraceae bacterium]